MKRYTKTVSKNGAVDLISMHRSLPILNILGITHTTDFNFTLKKSKDIYKKTGAFVNKETFYIFHRLMRLFNKNGIKIYTKYYDKPEGLLFNWA